MIRRVFRGRSVYGLVKYLYGEGRRNEHTNPHLIGSWDGHPAGIEPPFIPALGRHDVAPLVRLLELPVKACDRAPAQWVYHLVLRNDPGDRRLTDDEWAQVCAAAMDATGIAPADDPAGCRWVAVRHADDHVHLVATLAREDGRAPAVWNDWPKLATVAHRYEQEFGLRSTAGRDDHTADPRPGVQETVTAHRAGRTEPARITLRRAVQTAAAQSAGFDEFTARLAAHGITVWPRRSDRDPTQITGYSVSLNGWANAAGKPVRFGGGALAPDLTMPKLRARWHDTVSLAPADPRRTAHSIPRAGGSVADAESDRIWREAERIVHEAADRITAQSRTDPDAAADGAWATSDTLRAAAAAIERDTCGPLTHAADAFARAGRAKHRRTPYQTDTGTALRSAARMISLLNPGTGSTIARTAAVTAALAALVAAVADLRRSQDRVHQAEAAYVAAAGLAKAAGVVSRPSRSQPQRPTTAASLAGWSTVTTALRRPPPGSHGPRGVRAPGGDVGQPSRATRRFPHL